MTDKKPTTTCPDCDRLRSALKIIATWADVKDPRGAEVTLREIKSKALEALRGDNKGGFWG